MRLPGFSSGSYTSQSILADVERLVNMYPEIVESGAGKNKVVMYGRPGLRARWVLPDSPIRALFSQDGRTFCVAGGSFVELYSNGTFKVWGAVTNAGAMATMCSNGAIGHQIFVVSGGGYIFDTIANTFTQITAVAFPPLAVMGAYLDGYFIVLPANSNEFQLSAFEDGTQWSGLDFAPRESGSDNVQSLTVDHRELWLQGSLSTEVWYDSGDASFPFAPIPGAYIEQGAINPWSTTKIDNTIAFIGSDRNGTGIAFRANGYVPQRISTHAVEHAWLQYQTINDVEAFSYQEEGHLFMVVNFPTAKATWVYDAASHLWHERDWKNVATGLYEQGRARCHCLAWGLHLVGDRTTGTVYLQSLAYYDDAGGTINRRRRCPHLCAEQKWTFYDRVQLDAEVGNPFTQTFPGAYSKTVLNDGAIGAWSLGEPSGPAVDLVNGNNGAPVGAVTREIPGGVNDGGFATGFDGFTGYFTIPNNAILNPAGKFAALTMEAWVNASSVQVGASGARIALGIGVQNNYLGVLVNGQAVVSMFIGGVQQLAASGINIALGNWYHLVGTYDGANLKIYVNGVLKGTTPTVGTVDTVAGVTVLGDYAVTPGAGLGWEGAVEDAAVYSVALSAAQVANHYSFSLANVVPVAPKATLRWSNDGGRTWSNDYQVGLGLAGQYQVRAVWNRLGRARDRVFEFEVSDAIPVRYIDAYLETHQGTS
jgi:hypothetical protein